MQNWLREPFALTLRLKDSDESKEDARKQNILAFAKVVRQLPPNWNLLQHNRSCVVRNIGDNIARLSAIPCSTYTDEDRRSMVEQWNQGSGSLNILNDYIPVSHRTMTRSVTAFLTWARVVPPSRTTSSCDLKTTT